MAEASRVLATVAMRSYKAILAVHQEKQADVYHDRARIPEIFRGRIREGRICKISVGSQSALLEVRGINENDPIIRVGELARRSLGVEFNSRYAFCVREVWWIGQFRWAWQAADSASRIAARLGILGFVLGIIGLILGIVSLCH